MSSAATVPQVTIGGARSFAEPRAERLYLVALALALLGYALAGRGFAYLGFPPLFIGEALLAAGLLLMVRARSWSALLRVTPIMLLLPLVGWGIVRTLPYVSIYGIEALRDLAVFGYAAYAIIVAMLLLEAPRRLPMLVRWYRRYAFVLLLAVPVITTAYRLAWPLLPRWPWAPTVPMLQQKEGDMMVHFAAIVAFWTVGLAGRVHWAWIGLLTLCAAALGLIERAGLIAFAVVLIACVLLWPGRRIAAGVFVTAAACVAFLAISGLRLEVPGAGKTREVSFEQLVINARSLVGASGSEGMDSTKEWRLDWWSDIVSYTFGGRYFLKGKGFGVNLADDDGYQVLRDGSLRSPHNVHMNILARSGVPGLLLWIALQAAWMWAIVNAYSAAGRRGHMRWKGLFLFLACFWLACIVNASFDVFLEGPMGAIWFWTVFGVGAAAVELYRRNPALLDEVAEPIA